MKYVIVSIIGILAVIVLCFWAYNRYPRTDTFTYEVRKEVPEKRTRTVKEMVEVDGQMVEVEVLAIDTIYTPVWETKTREVQPTLLEKLQFWCLSIIAVIFGGYMLFVLGLWARDKVGRKRESADTRDTQKRIDGIVTFCTGILVGFLGSSDFGEKPTVPEESPPAEIAPLDDPGPSRPPEPAPEIPQPIDSE